jgi:hypothetical protein
MTRRKFRYRNTDGLRFLQVNVGRSGPAHDIALSLAYDSKADFIAIQEPWVSNNPNRPLTKSHPSFRTSLHKPENGTRPRVASYIRKSSHIRATQTTTGHNRDFFSLHLQLTDRWTIDVWNVYNAPAGSQDAGQGLCTLIDQSPPSRTLIVGDFNCRHASWDPSTDYRPPLGDSLEEWAQQHGLNLLNGYTQTHNRGGVLDLAWSNVPQIETIIAPHLHSTSDHETLLTSIPRYKIRESHIQGKLKYEDCNTKTLLQLLAYPSGPISLDPEENARSLTRDLSIAVSAATPQIQTRSIGAPWWTEECRVAARIFKWARRTGPAYEEQRKLRNLVRSAKAAFWKSKVENAKDLPSIYKIVKWHNSIPSYSSPPLQGPNGVGSDSSDKVVV